MGIDSRHRSGRLDANEAVNSNATIPVIMNLGRQDIYFSREPSRTGHDTRDADQITDSSYGL